MPCARKRCSGPLRANFLGLSQSRSGQDGTVVILQKLEPVLDIARVAVEMRDRQPQLGAQHGAGEFGDEFFGGIGRCAEAVLEITSQAAGMAGPVRQLVCERGVVVIETRE